jgi:hypothetical protein
VAASTRFVTKRLKPPLVLNVIDYLMASQKVAIINDGLAKSQPDG